MFSVPCKAYRTVIELISVNYHNTRTLNTTDGGMLLTCRLCLSSAKLFWHSIYIATERINIFTFYCSTTAAFHRHSVVALIHPAS